MASIGRASALIAAGTLISRITGLVRTMLLAWVFGSVSMPADAFSTANQLPSMVFTIISAGLLTAVFVPQIVRAAKHADGGSAFVSKLFTLSTVVLLAVTALAMLAVPLLVTMYAPTYDPAQRELAIAMAYWFVPQVLFFGLFTIVGEALNARGTFGPYTWAPIANNLVSIAGFLAFILIFDGPLREISQWTGGPLAMLGSIVTGGVIIQFLVLIMFWRKAKLPIRVDFNWRGVGLRGVAKQASWTLAMVLVGTIAGVVQTAVMNEVSKSGAAGPNVWGFAWLVFMLPYSIIVISIGTPYFTRISEHASEGRMADVRADVSACIRTLGVFMVLATAALVAAAAPAARMFSQLPSEALQAAPVLLMMLVGLIPLSVLFIVQRTFYAFGNTRTPFIFTAIQSVIVIGGALIAGAFIEHAYVTAGVALAQSIATTIQTVIAVALLRRRLGSGLTRVWGVALLRFVGAAIPAVAAGIGTYLATGGNDGWSITTTGFAGQFAAVAGVALIGTVTAIVYIIMLAVLRAPEVRIGVDAVRKFIKR